MSPLTFLDLKIPWPCFLLCHSHWILSNKDPLLSPYSTSWWLGWECFIKNTSRQIDLRFVCLPVCSVCLFGGDEGEPRLKATADQQSIVKLHSQLIFTFSFLRQGLTKALTQDVLNTRFPQHLLYLYWVTRLAIKPGSSLGFNACFNFLEYRFLCQQSMALLCLFSRDAVNTKYCNVAIETQHKPGLWLTTSVCKLFHKRVEEYSVSLSQTFCSLIFFPILILIKFYCYVGCPSACCEYLLLPLVNKGDNLANSQAEYS